jgi:hypothetical protein
MSILVSTASDKGAAKRTPSTAATGRIATSDATTRLVGGRAIIREANTPATATRAATTTLLVTPLGVATGVVTVATVVLGIVAVMAAGITGAISLPTPEGRRETIKADHVSR